MQSTLKQYLNRAEQILVAQQARREKFQAAKAILSPEHLETLKALFKDDSNADYTKTRALLRRDLELAPGTPDCLGQFVVFLVQQRKREPSWVTEMIESMIDKPTPVIHKDSDVINTALRAENAALKRDKIRAESLVADLTKTTRILKEAIKDALETINVFLTPYVEQGIVKPLDQRGL